MKTHTKISKGEAIDSLVSQYGYKSDISLAEEYIFDPGMPAICLNMNCGAVYEMEPDQSEGWCEPCGDNSVQSLAILMGII